MNTKSMVSFQKYTPEYKMIKLLKLLKNLFTIKTKQQLEEEYLAKSTDLYDLERRQRQLSYRKGYYI